MTVPPDDFSRPPVEQLSTEIPEFTPPPPEYSYGEAAPETPGRKRRLMPFAAGVIAAAALISLFVRAPQILPPVPPEPTTVTAPTAEPTVPVTETAPPTEPVTETAEPTAAPAETAPPETEPPFEPEVLASWDNPGGTCIITVYGDVFDLDVFGNPILLEQTVDEDSFTELALPECPVYGGRTVLGYAIEYSPTSANFTAAGYNPGTAPFALAVGDSLSLDELRLVPVWEDDGIRHVYLHPVWVTEDGFTEWEHAPVVTLDGQPYSLDLPLASGGSLYVCALVPEQEGSTFAGWYDTEGNRVYAVLAEDLFTTTLPGSSEIDWTQPDTIALTSRWVKNPD